MFWAKCSETLTRYHVQPTAVSRFFEVRLMNIIVKSHYLAHCVSCKVNLLHQFVWALVFTHQMAAEKVDSLEEKCRLLKQAYDWQLKDTKASTAVDEARRLFIRLWKAKVKLVIESRLVRTHFSRTKYCM